MAVQEQSAGVVVFRQAPQRHYLLLDFGKYWNFPGGHLKPNEAPQDAARRELAEETGIEAVELVTGFVRQITYFFRDKKKVLIRKTVIFYLAQTATTEVKLSDEHVGFAFLPHQLARQRLTYASARQVLDEAEEFLCRSQPAADSEAKP